MIRFGLHVFLPMITFTWLSNQLSSVGFHKYSLSSCSVQGTSTCLLLPSFSDDFTHNPQCAPALFILCLCIPAPLLDHTFLKDSNDHVYCFFGHLPLSPDTQSTFPGSFTISFSIHSIIYTLLITVRQSTSPGALKIRDVLFRWTLSINGCYD